MGITAKQIAAVLSLPGPDRYRHFIKRVVDSEEAWGLYDQGWALAGKNDDNKSVFPMWPAREYAQRSAENEWAGYTPRSIGLEELMNELLPQLKRDDVLPGVFYTPGNQGVIPSVEELHRDLEVELQKYL